MTKRRTKVNLIINFGLDHQSRIAIPPHMNQSSLHECACADANRLAATVTRVATSADITTVADSSRGSTGRFA